MSNLPESLDSKYCIIKPISYSEKSSVYLLNKKEEGSNAVVKIIKADRQNKRLVETLSDIFCDYICKPLEYCIKGNFLYIVYPYYTPLTELLVNSSLSLKEVLCLGIDICKALLYLHKNNIMHMDISAGNIYKSDNGNYVLGDYSNAVFISSIREKAVSKGNIFKIDTDAYICDCKSLVIFLLTLLNKGENTETVCKSMEKELPDKLLSILSLSEISFINEDIILDKIRSGFVEIKDSDDILNSKYHVNVKEKNHCLISKKTVPIKINIYDNKIHSEQIITFKKFIPYAALLICGLVFIISFYSFVIKDKDKHNSNIGINKRNELIQSDDKPFVCDVSDMGIQAFPENIYSMKLYKNKKMSDIDIVYANSNSISSLLGISSCKNIRELYLSDNKLSDLNEIEKLDKLNVLVLSYNNITDLTLIAEMESLIFLDLSGNINLENIGMLEKLKNLRMLILSETGISKNEVDFLRKQLPRCEVII